MREILILAYRSGPAFALAPIEVNDDMDVTRGFFDDLRDVFLRDDVDLPILAGDGAQEAADHGTGARGQERAQNTPCDGADAFGGLPLDLVDVTFLRNEVCLN